MQSEKQRRILQKISSKKGQVAVLIDPDEVSGKKQINDLVKKCEFAQVDYFFVGGSTVSKQDFDTTIALIKQTNSKIPIVIFPGSSQQVSEKADAILFLSLISGRNPDFLIGHHIQSANELFEMDIEVIPTGYLLIDGGTKSSVAYVSQTTPIPSSNKSIVVNTAKAGILLGHKAIFLDAGSGAKYYVPQAIISELSKINCPIIVGGGIRSMETLEELKDANVIVIGNKIEEDIDFLIDIKQFKEQSV